jgi:glycosyltransferase involved in cell wall biosynthesis
VRIVHLVTSGDAAGGQTVALQLARAAHDRGDTATFVSPSDGPFLEQARAEGFRVHLVDLTRTFHLPDAVRLARLLRELHTDVLHTHTQLAPNILGRPAARGAGVAVVSHLHIENYFRPNRLVREIHRRLDNATARLCARVIVVSEATRRALLRQGYPPELMEVVYNGVELDDGHDGDGLRRELGIGPDVPVVGEIARLAEVKGQRELIEAMARVGNGARLVLIGDDLEAGGAYRRELEAEAARLGVGDRVLFAGFRPDARALLRELDLVVLPSWTEGLPIVVLEAMAARKPVVATPVGGTAELVTDGETGVLVSPRDVDALADAVGGLLGDSERRRRLGEAGYCRVAEHFSAERMTRRVLEIYDEVVSCRS